MRSVRLKWLDLHNLLGIVTLVWATVVGATGVVNTLATPLVEIWQARDVEPLLADYRGRELVPESERASLQASREAALAHAPGKQVRFAAFPGTVFSSPHHVTWFLHGDTPLTAKLLRPVLVDARSATVTAAPELPWYLSALLLSQPLHFGDYAGMPMKILWALLDLATIVVLGSGLYLWIRRRSAQRDRVAKLGTNSDLALRPRIG